MVNCTEHPLNDDISKHQPIATGDRQTPSKGENKRSISAHQILDQFHGMSRDGPVLIPP